MSRTLYPSFVRPSSVRPSSVRPSSSLRSLLWTAAGIALLMLLAVAPSIAEETPTPWPQWRGPHFNGTQPGANPPIHFSETKNVKFKVEVPGHGLASPIIYDDVVYLLSAEAADAEAQEKSRQSAQSKLENNEWPPAVEPVAQSFVVLAFSAETGELLWRRTASKHVPHETHYLDASWASATPATDGEMLYAHFGSNGTFAYDLKGNLAWKQDLGDMTTRNGFGEGTSPLIWRDLLIIAWDHEGDSFMVALDKKTGEQRWRVDRPEEASSWVTPIVVDPDGKGEMGPQVILSGTGKSRGYNALTGEEIWALEGMTTNTIPSPVARDHVVYLMSGFRGNALQAIDLKRAKGPAHTALVFSHNRHTPYVPSPVLIDDNLCFIKHNKNGFTCLNADTGDVRFTEVRLPGIQNVYGSPVATEDRIYIFDKDGTGTVIKNSHSFEVLAENQLDEGVDSTPAIYGDSLYVRSLGHLYRIATAEPAPAPPSTKKPASTKPATTEESSAQESSASSGR